MTMTEWIHCNKCFLRFQPKSKFYLTSCGHLKCEKCVSTIGPEKKCLICNAVCSTVQLTNNLKPDIQCFFQPYNEFQARRAKVFSFQQSNSVSLLNNISAKYNTSKGEIIKYRKAIDNIKKQNSELLKIITSASRSRFRQSSPGYAFASSTPMPGFNSTPVNAAPHRTPGTTDPSNAYGACGNLFANKLPSWNQPTFGGRTNNLNAMPSFGSFLLSPIDSRMETTPNHTRKAPTMVSMSHLGFPNRNRQK